MQTQTMKLQCQCLKIPVIEGKSQQIKSWIAGLSNRSNEVVDALKSEGINDEAVFLSQEDGAEFLYLYSRSENLAAAGQVFQESTLVIDVEFKQVLAECLDFSKAVPLNLVFCADFSRQSVFSATMID